MIHFYYFIWFCILLHTIYCAVFYKKLKNKQKLLKEQISFKDKRFTTLNHKQKTAYLYNFLNCIKYSLFFSVLKFVWFILGFFTQYWPIFLILIIYFYIIKKIFENRKESLILIWINTIITISTYSYILYDQYSYLLIKFFI